MSRQTWITAREAADILSTNSQKTIRPDYVLRLHRLGKIKARTHDGRSNEYLKSDVEAYRVGSRGRKKEQ